MNINKELPLPFPELLSPVGGKEQLLAAVEYGCDAVYLSGKKFSARNNASNFDEEELSKTIDYCHLRGVKVYVAVNILYKQEEINDVFNYVKKVCEIGADAIILHDIGLLKLLRENLLSLMDDKIPFHASTQLTAHSLEDVNFLSNLGFERVVLSRELSIEEIEHITQNTKCEIEIFVHGALCVCYSGQCLASSFLGGRSGNRGSCAQPCRLPYKLSEDNDEVANGYLLSPKDMAAYAYVDRLKKAGVACFKIEGRMKNPEYVASVTDFYHDYIHETNDSKEVMEEKLRNMSQSFNRGGEFSSGYFGQHSGKSMMSITTPKPQGNSIGQVVHHNKRSNFCKIKLYEDVIPGDGIQITTINNSKKNYDNDNNGNNSEVYTGAYINIKAKAGEVIEINTKIPVNEGDTVRKSYDKALHDAVSNSIKKDTKKLVLETKVSVLLDGNFTFSVSKDGISATIIENIVQKAENKAVDKEKIIEQLNRTGDTSFKLDYKEIIVDDNIFVPMSKINQLRRDVLNEFSVKWVNSYKREIDEIEYNQEENKLIYQDKKINILFTNENMLNFFINNFSKLKLTEGLESVYIDFGCKYIDEETINKYAESIRKLGLEMLIALPHITREYDTLKKYINVIEKTSVDGYLVRTYGQLQYLKDVNTRKITVADYTFHIYNSHSLDNMKEFTDSQTLSVEINYDDMQDVFANAQENVGTEIIVYGHIPFMITSQCPVGLYKSKKEGKKFCKSRFNNREFSLKDRKNMDYPVLTNCNECYAQILNPVPLWLVDKFHDIEKLPCTNIRLIFTIEDNATIIKTINEYLTGLSNPAKNSVFSNSKNIEQIARQRPEGSFTYGHFYKGVM